MTLRKIRKIIKNILYYIKKFHLILNRIPKYIKKKGYYYLAISIRILISMFIETFYFLFNLLVTFICIFRYLKCVLNRKITNKGIRRLYWFEVKYFFK